MSSQDPAPSSLIPEELHAAIDRYVAVNHREEILLDIADALHALVQRGEHARVTTYVADVIASLSMDRDQLDTY